MSKSAIISVEISYQQCRNLTIKSHRCPVAEGALPDALEHEIEATLLLRLIEVHADYSPTTDTVLVVHYLLWNDLTHVKRELAQTGVEHERLPLSR